ncbi:TPA: hypothetical protein SIA32_000942 [Aeromonas sobria]|nr:hypothetical protein [Aeromonas sobria]
MIAIRQIQASMIGQWYGALESAGITLPKGRHHGPCPLCGGRDRFRFDDKDGRGTWICNQCGAGDGLTLFARSSGLSVKEAIPFLASMCGLSRSMSASDLSRIEAQRQKAAERAEQQRQKEASQREAAAALANLMADEAIIVDASEHPYLARKGYSGFPVFVTVRAYQHECSGKRYDYASGCLLHSIRDTNAEIIGAELVRDNGIKTALAGGSKAGVVVIEPPVDMPLALVETVFIVEGVATGYAVRQLLGMNAIGFAALSKNNLLRATEIARALIPELPIVVCGDVGAEAEAERAAAAVGGVVSFPPSGDWDDFRAEVAA